MATEDTDFFLGSREIQDKNPEEFTLYATRPLVENDDLIGTIITSRKEAHRVVKDSDQLVQDGLYVCDNPLTDSIIKPRVPTEKKVFQYMSKPAFNGKMVEIAIREIKLYPTDNNSTVPIQITSVSILCQKKIVCKTKYPFNRKLHKVLIRSCDQDKLSMRVNAKRGQTSLLPLPLPRRNVKESKLEIDFGITDINGKIFSGTVVCTVSIMMHGSESQEEMTLYTYKTSNDPNDPQNYLSLQKSKTSSGNKDAESFFLEDPDLYFDVKEGVSLPKKVQKEVSKPPDIVVLEQSISSLLSISFGNIFQAKRPLRPSSGIFRPHAIGKEVLMITILRGVEVPVREESALVQPLLEIEWGGVVQTTSVADGPAPVWQQTVYFEVPRQSGKECVKIRLYDQHPVWGQQWLGETRIPVEYHRSYQEIERWIVLNPLYSPTMLFGYVQASPGHSCTKFYVLMKVEQGGSIKSIEDERVDTLCKGIQRCLATPYKVIGVESPDEAAHLAMLLSTLPAHYGPLSPRQALNLNKVDHYGRAALLATLLQAFSLQSYVLLGSSQTNKWFAYVLSLPENGEIILWDPEIGDRYSLDDSRCSLLKVSRLINHANIWENVQKAILPHVLRYDVKVGKDWHPLGPATSSGIPTIQTLDLKVSAEEEDRQKSQAQEIEQYLRDKLAQWRSTAGLTTVFNRHAVNILRTFVSKVDGSTKPRLERRDLKQLYRAYHTHGFVLNLRESNLEELAEHISSTKIQTISGPIEFALVCHLQRYVGKICSIWLVVAVLRSRV